MRIKTNVAYQNEPEYWFKDIHDKERKLGKTIICPLCGEEMQIIRTENTENHIEVSGLHEAFPVRHASDHEIIYKCYNCNGEFHANLTFEKTDYNIRCW